MEQYSPSCFLVSSVFIVASFPTAMDLSTLCQPICAYFPLQILHLKTRLIHLKLHSLRTVQKRT